MLVGSALAVVLTRNLFHSVLWLALSLVGTAGIFLLLDAEFLAAVQVLLYAGGVSRLWSSRSWSPEAGGGRISHTSRGSRAGHRGRDFAMWRALQRGPDVAPRWRRHRDTGAAHAYLLPLNLACSSWRADRGELLREARGISMGLPPI
jgi:hypothetical protein